MKPRLPGKTLADIRALGKCVELVWYHEEKPLLGLGATHPACSSCKKSTPAHQLGFFLRTCSACNRPFAGSCTGTPDAKIRGAQLAQIISSPSDFFCPECVAKSPPPPPQQNAKILAAAPTTSLHDKKPMAPTSAPAKSLAKRPASGSSAKINDQASASSSAPALPLPAPKSAAGSKNKSTSAKTSQGHASSSAAAIGAG
jgi:hypothetical protein